MKPNKTVLPVLAFAILLFWGCNKAEKESFDPLIFVDPMVGTGAHGHTFPGPTLPNGMVQLSPDTHLLGWEASSGYHYPDTLLYAFSHTHLSGTGIGDLGDVAILPFTGVDSLKPVGLMDKSTEKARPGYYVVQLKNFGIKAELTTTERVGMHRYTAEKNRPLRLMLDLAHILQPNWGHSVVKNDLNILTNGSLSGTYYTKGWAENHRMSYHMETSLPADSIALWIDGHRRSVESLPVNITDSSDIKVYLYFPASEKSLLVKVGLSPVSPENARENMYAELPHWDFDKVVTESREIWRNALSNIRIRTADTAVLKNFYTALYHMNIAPYNYQDINGEYRGIDKQIHKGNPADGYYTVFSIWDTYRALHPMLTITDPQRALRYGRSLVADYDNGSILPRWPLASNYTGCMPGYHAVSIMADLVTKGITTAKDDLKHWTEAAVRSSVFRADLDVKFRGTREHDLITRHPYFKETSGFVPCDSVEQSVSWGVEMAYDDWCIARIAEAAGSDSVKEAYDRRGLYYRRYWDKETNLMRPVMADGTFKTPFYPRFSNHTGNDYTEGNAYQWSFYAPHDMEGFIALMGGADVLEANLDTLFYTSSRLEGQPAGDITGLIGQYVHGNEPSHHIAYLYNHTGHPHKAQLMLDSIMYHFYQPAPDGIIGNEDCGQMSAWYVMSAMGFYQVCPGKPVYYLGRPIVDEAVIKIPGGDFMIKVHGNSRADKYVQKVLLNGRTLKEPYLPHTAIKPGSRLDFFMGKTPKS
ncbi:GH92 family glycosyl hydrolase [Porphyromonas macacae]|uniref:GH92 family glycosyl hydrolase n=1 Tax=Porphyromonas macacae TaxID=28115 RepID=UPI0024AE051D|nr:GH92 family glycosyl hydrolase [Porphyromonas macacae]